MRVHKYMEFVDYCHIVLLYLCIVLILAASDAIVPHTGKSPLEPICTHRTPESIIRTN
jgi:hypothetical protein